MNAAGRYVAPGQKVVNGEVVGEPPDADTATFWISGLVSPFKSFGDRAADYIRAVQSGDQERIRVVVNTGFGELYTFRGDAPKKEEVRSRSQGYRFGDVPEEVRWITAYVDVQKRRFVYAIRGWASAMESWLLEADEIHGETEYDQVWAELAEFRLREFGRKKLRIRRLGVDSGYRPGEKWRRPDNQIYAFCRRFRGWALATKGQDRLPKPLRPALIDVTLKGQTYKQGLQLWHLDTDFFKSWVHSRLEWPAAQPGGWWVPEDVSDDYCQQLTAEARTVKPTGQAVWIRIRRENHFLDCEAGNVAMAYSLGLHRVRRKKPNADEAVATSETKSRDVSPPSSEAEKRTVRRPQRLPRSAGWVKGWR
jgi:phage terminase large subunit GpA-like protein